MNDTIVPSPTLDQIRADLLTDRQVRLFRGFHVFWSTVEFPITTIMCLDGSEPIQRIIAGLREIHGADTVLVDINTDGDMPTLRVRVWRSEDELRAEWTRTREQVAAGSGVA